MWLRTWDARSGDRGLLPTSYIRATGNGHVVVYFAADEEDISVQDAQYTDILLACTRHLLRVVYIGINAGKKSASLIRENQNV